jgi:hypothetical protein
MNKVFIFAGTAEQANILARWHDMAPNEWVYVSDHERLRGCRQQTLWLFGTWKDRHDFRDVINFAKVMDFRIFTIEDHRYIEGLS